MKSLMRPCCFAALAMCFMTGSLRGQQNSPGVAVSPVREVRSVSDVFARPTTVDFQHVTLRHALDLLAASTDVRIMYKGQVVDAIATPITLRAANLSLGVVFDRILAGTGLQAVSVTRELIAIRVSDVAAVSGAQGVITGKVFDAKTKQPLRGATVSLDGTGKGIATDDYGTFRFANVAPGAHTVSIRMLGYVRVTKTAVVTEGQTASLEVTLDASVNALDQVVVTGTIVATAQKAVPNAMTIVTAKQIEERGITSIDQLFRGEIPGLFVPNRGSSNTLDQVYMFSRGASGFSGAGTIKTYVDGVELADPSYLSQISPQSIERIEILTGPQASTIYGSNAINGVMQIFTKRGTSIRPRLMATLLSGLVQNNFRPTLTPQHDYSAQVNSTDGRWSYNTGGSWNYIGPWTPSKQTSRIGGYGGVSMHSGALNADASFRQSHTQNRSYGSYMQDYAEYRAAGIFAFNSSVSGTTGRDAPTNSTADGQTLGLTAGYAPFSWWSHELVLGRDALATETIASQAKEVIPSDTLLSVSQTSTVRTSLRYSTTARIPIGTFTQMVVTAGADGWRNMTIAMNASSATTAGSLTGLNSATRAPGRNTGTFVQGQLGIGDQLFITYGLRAEWNPDYGDAVGANSAPRYGVAYSRDIGPVTAKLRASYGRSTRPPPIGEKQAAKVTGATKILEYGLYDNYLANPDLGPESQQGGEGGLELYLGQRGSLTITRYNQTVNNLIASVYGADSVFSLAMNPTGYLRRTADGYGYYYQYQYLNVASIRNQGWEGHATIADGPLTLAGTYSWTKSRVLGVTERYRALLVALSNKYAPGSSMQRLPEHTWALDATYARGGTLISLNVNGTGHLSLGGFDEFEALLYGGARLSSLKPRMSEPSGYVPLGPGYTMANLNVVQRISSRVEGVLQVQNLNDFYQSDDASYDATIGRQTKAGLRIRL